MKKIFTILAAIALFVPSVSYGALFVGIGVSPTGITTAPVQSTSTPLVNGQPTYTNPNYAPYSPAPGIIIENGACNPKIITGNTVANCKAEIFMGVGVIPDSVLNATTSDTTETPTVNTHPGYDVFGNPVTTTLAKIGTSTTATTQRVAEIKGVQACCGDSPHVPVAKILFKPVKAEQATVTQNIVMPTITPVQPVITVKSYQAQVREQLQTMLQGILNFLGQKSG